MDDQRVKDIAHSDGEVAMSTTSSNDGDTALATEPKVMTTQPDEAISSSSSQNTDKAQMECPICLQTCIHPARLPCGHIFCFLCVKGVAVLDARCAMCRREIPVEFLDHPHLLYNTEEKPPTSEDEYQWFYEGRNGWWQYDERTSQELEDAYKEPDKLCTILVAGYVYIIDFETMLQQRDGEPSRKRKVKRDLATGPKKGVAGLRIAGAVDPLVTSTVAAAASAVVAGDDAAPYRLDPYYLISTITATDAAIRIASDSIDSTLVQATTDAHSIEDSPVALDLRVSRS